MNTLFETVLANAQVVFHYSVGPFVFSDRAMRDGDVYRGRYYSLRLSRKANEHMFLLQWKQDAPRKLKKIELLCTEHIKGSFRFFKNGYQSWTVTRSYRPEEVPLRYKKPWYLPVVDPVAAIQDNMNNLPSHKPYEHASESFVALKNTDTGICEFAGIMPDFTDFIYFRAWFDESGIERMAITYDYDGFELPAKTKERQICSIFVDSGHEEKVFETYFNMIQKRLSLHISGRVPAGWCSWYYYFTNITPESILSNLEECKKRKLPLDYFQVDDGWQRHVGDWLVMRNGFEGKMRMISEEIHRAGYRSGLWLAPFIATVKSETYRNHPDWFIGKPSSPITRFKAYGGYNPNWEGAIFLGLDITNPEAEAYVRNVIRTVVHEWGYDVIKIDFLYAAAMSGICRNNSLTRADRMLRGLRAVREEAGKKTFILGCGIPIMQGIGLVDGNRIGEDVAPYWTGTDDITWGGESHVGTKNALRNTLNRTCMHRRFWLNDPDCLMLRDTETELKANERKLLRDVICVSNGMIILSDNMKQLGEERMADLRDALALSKKLDGGKVYTMGIMDDSHPKYLFNSAGALLAMNFNDGQTEIRLDADQLARICGTLKMKVPGKYRTDDGKNYNLKQLKEGITINGRSSVLMFF